MSSPDSSKGWSIQNESRGWALDQSFNTDRGYSPILSMDVSLALGYKIVPYQTTTKYKCSYHLGCNLHEGKVGEITYEKNISTFYGRAPNALTKSHQSFSTKSRYAINLWIQNIISMLLCKTAVTPLLTYWSYCSLALSHRSIPHHCKCHAVYGTMLSMVEIYNSRLHR